MIVSLVMSTIVVMMMRCDLSLRIEGWQVPAYLCRGISQRRLLHAVAETEYYFPLNMSNRSIHASFKFFTCGGSIPLSVINDTHSDADGRSLRNAHAEKSLPPLAGIIFYVLT